MKDTLLSLLRRAAGALLDLLYTAVTRARRLVMIVGREAAIDQMIANAHTRKRYSALCYRLKQMFELSTDLQ